MGLEEVKKDIIDNAKKEVGKVEKETAAAIKEIETAAKTAVKAQEKDMQKQQDHALALLEETKKAAAKGNETQAVLQKKMELIESTLADASKALAKKNDAYCEKLVEKVKKEMNVKKVYCRGKPKGVTAEKQDINGLIAENSDGSISIDCSFETLLAQIKEQHVQEIAEVLFK